MMKKVKAACYTSLTLSVIILIFSIADGGLWIFPIVLMYALAGNLAYGIPVSILSDWLTKRMGRGRMLAAGIIHASFGGLTYLVIDGFAWFAVICAVIFFFVDEWLKRKDSSEVDGDNKRFYLKAGSVVVVLAIVIVAVNWIPGRNEQPAGKYLYLIPEGYEGTIVVFHGAEDRPPLKNDEGYSLIPVEVESLPTLMRTDIERYGIYRTSTRDRSYNLSQNRYVYVDNVGNRTPMADECIHHSGGGSISGTEIFYDEIQVTETSCGEHFSTYGNERFSAQGREIGKYYEDQRKLD
ncbi:hypothetical protein KYJ26_12150 [Bacillus sp. MCCB 382]|uniref:DUF6843 domain-containing protein n=2 Tax=Bacillaceae TaxID=186817 RepID=UPI001C56F6AF|nr:hypothetical protein [Bacillus sp. MCCB 382]